MNEFVSFIAFAIKFSTVFIFGATGEIINQKSGHLNMGTPGIMYLGAIGGVLGEAIYCTSIPAGTALNPLLIVLIPILFAILFGAVGGLIFSFFTVTLHCNQNVTGLTLTTFGTALSKLLIDPITKLRIAKGSVHIISDAGIALQSIIPSSFYSKLGWFGEIFLSQSLFTYLGLVLAIVTAIVIAKTRIGLNLRAVGENAASADSAGINVNKYRYVATIIGGAIAGIGGAFFELDQVKGMINAGDAVDAYGWLALCIVIFAMWKPLLAIAASFLFAFLSSLPYYMSGGGVLSYIFKMSPYIFTLLVLIGLSLFENKRNQPPANLGISYFREER